MAICGKLCRKAAYIIKEEKHEREKKENPAAVRLSGLGVVIWCAALSLLAYTRGYVDRRVASLCILDKGTKDKGL